MDFFKIICCHFVFGNSYFGRNRRGQRSCHPYSFYRRFCVKFVLFCVNITFVFISYMKVQYSSPCNISDMFHSCPQCQEIHLLWIVCVRHHAFNRLKPAAEGIYSYFNTFLLKQGNFFTTDFAFLCPSNYAEMYNSTCYL